MVRGLADALVVVTGHPRTGDVRELTGAVAELQRDRFGVVIDLSGLVVCHLELLGALVRARREAAELRLPFTVELDGRATRPDVRRVLSLVGLVGEGA